VDIYSSKVSFIPVIKVTQCHMILQRFGAQETSFIIINVENNYLHLYFKILRWIKSSKEHYLSEIESFYTIKTWCSKVWGQSFQREIKENNSYIL